jgi:2'-5' RNA ligase
MSESAIVVRIRVPAAIERLRKARDWAARRGVPAHVTILYPFVNGPELTPAVRRQVAEIAGEFRAFEVSFSTVGRWPGVVYLEPVPASRFSALIDRCAAAFPEHPPYAGTIAEVIPHLTVVEGDDVDVEEIVEAAAAALPFRARADGMEVLVEGDDDRWRGRWRLPFRP